MTVSNRSESISGPPQLTVEQGKATICFNRSSQHNRIEPADLDTLIDLFEQIDRNPDCRVLILTGSGKSFSSGYHIGALTGPERSGQQPRDPDAFQTMVDTLESLKIPTIAALNGGIYGGATDLALACDFRIGVVGMQMFMPAARLGIVYYESGLRRYVSRLGLDNAKKLFLTAAPVKAEEMLAMGFVSELTAPDQLMSRAHALADQITGNAPLALMALKRALNDIAAGQFDAVRHLCDRDRCMSSQDHQEGLAAWRDRRKPIFRGQ
ncbi:MAG: enoyl-CoA hydratase/isomerase family protein [Hyphomicrobiaceae bacterium]